MWVAEKKHAHYPAQAACNSGVTFVFIELEHCEFNNIDFVYPVTFTQQNIGSDAAPLTDCAVAFSGSASVDPSALECMWTSITFSGWQGFSSNGGSMPMLTSTDQFDLCELLDSPSESSSPLSLRP